MIRRHLPRILSAAAAAVAAAALALAAGAEALGQPQLTLGSATAAPGDTVSLPVTLSVNGSAPCALSLDVSYDSEALTFQGAQVGPAGTGAGKQAATSTPLPGVARLALYGLNQTALGSGVVATLTFQVSPGAARDQLLGTACSASDCAGSALATTCSGGAISVQACVLTCTASAVPSSGSPPLAVAFSAGASGQYCPAASYDWDFGDGSAHSAQANVTHTYVAAGDYTWTLVASVQDSYRCSRTGTVTVTSACVPPAITVQPSSQTIGSGQTASLSVSATGTAPMNYQWYRGTSPDTSNPVGTNASSFTTPPLTATTSYWVRVSNGCGHADSATATVTVSAGCVLSCTAAVPSSGTAGAPVSFASTATPSGCTGTPSFAWTFGDGQTSNAQNPTHTFALAGTYGWSLTVSLQGATCTRSGTIVISTGGGAVTLYESGFESESGLAGWDTGYFSGGNNSTDDWRGVMACTAHGGSKVFRFGGSDCTAPYADQDNSFASPGGSAGLSFPAGASQARLSFWHRWEFESGYDGAMLRISVDHQNYYYIPGSAPGVWIEGGYNGTVAYGSGTRDMWTGTSAGYPASFIRTQVDLDAAVNYALSTTTGAAGRTLWISFGGFSDTTIHKEGWYLDDVAVTCQGSGSCTLSCTATVPSSGTAGAPVSFASTATPSGCTGTPAFAWTFGDGQTSNAQNPTHTYASAGAYGWSLTVSVQGTTCTKSGTLAIATGASNNDQCADAILISGETSSRSFSTAGFGQEAGEPTPSCQSRFGATGWLRFTPQAAGRVTLATCGSDFDTVLALYSGGCGSWVPVACSDDGCGLQSQISSAVVSQGTPYLVQVSGYQGATGTVAFSYTFTPGLPPPPVITAMTKLVPFGIKVTGSNLQNGIRVFINGTEWTNVQWKNTGKVKILGGKALKTAVPRGVTTQFRFLNPDGGEATTTWSW